MSSLAIRQLKAEVLNARGGQSDVDTRLDTIEAKVVYSSEYSDFSASVAAIGSTPTELVINSDVTISSSPTYPSTLYLSITPGNLITVADGETLTFYSAENIIASPRQRVFSGDGLVAFTVGGTVYPHWFNSKSDGATDDTAALSSAFNSNASEIGIIAGSGDYMISSEIEVTNTNLKRVFGIGNPTIDRSQTAEGTTEYNMLKFNGIDDLTIEGLTLEQDEYDTGGDASDENHRGMLITGCDRVTVRNNVFLKTGTYAIEFYNCNEVLAENNHVERSSRKAVGVRGCYGLAAFKSKKIIYKNNNFKNLSVGAYATLRTGDGTFFTDLQDFIVSDNIFDNLSENNVYGGGYNRATITGNVFRNAVTTAIKVRGRRVSITGNTIDTSAIGIAIKEAFDFATVTGNIIIANYDSGIATTVIGINVDVAALDTYISSHSLAATTRSRDITITGNTLRYIGAAGEEKTFGIRIFGDSDYTTEDAYGLQQVLINANVIDSFMTGVRLQETSQNIIITNNILIGQDTASRTSDQMGNGIYYEAYCPDTIIENNIVKRFYDGIVFDSDAASIARSTTRFNYIQDNQNYGINYETTTGNTTHVLEKNWFINNTAGNVTGLTTGFYTTTVKGADAAGTNVMSANANQLVANTGFIRLYDEDGGTVYVPYWSDITP